jgi:N-acetylglucosamine-6-phosphate deacetylase
MIKAVKNAVEHCGVDVADAVNFASLNPARLLGVSERIGSIEATKDADIVIFDRDFNVKMTMVRGKIVYQRGARGKKCAE